MNLKLKTAATIQKQNVFTKPVGNISSFGRSLYFLTDFKKDEVLLWYLFHSFYIRRQRQ